MLINWPDITCLAPAVFTRPAGSLSPLVIVAQKQLLFCVHTVVLASLYGRGAVYSELAF